MYQFFNVTGLFFYFFSSYCFTHYILNCLFVFIDFIFVVKFFNGHFFLVFIQDLNIETDRLKFFEQYFKGFRYAWFRNIFTFNNFFVRFHTTYNVIRLNGKQLLQGVGCTIGFERPHFHFPEPLTTKLSFTTQWLLCNEGVRACRTSMNLIINQMVKFKHVNVTNGNTVIHRFTSTTIV